MVTKATFSIHVCREGETTVLKLYLLIKETTEGANGINSRVVILEAGHLSLETFDR